MQQQSVSLSGRLTEAVRSMPEYEAFQDAEAALYRIPGLKASVDKLRREIYELNESDSDNFLEETDRFRAEHRELLDKPEVAAYLRAEAELCGHLRRLYCVAVNSCDVPLP